jgi:hypothetical protein
MRRLAWVAAPIYALALACGGGNAKGGDGETPPELPPPSDPPPAQPPPPPPAQPPMVNGDFTFYGTAQGLSPDVWDVSADEAGNVYVVTGDALLAKRRGDADFKAFAPAAAGVTRNCDAGKTVACPLVSVAGGPPGVAYVGLKGIGTDGDTDPDWQISSGGIDVLAFDGTAVTRTRHVEVAGVPHQMCEDHTPPPCANGDIVYEKGRRKVRQVLRMVVNHDASKVQGGDVWIAGTHGSFSLLVANPDKRGWVDLTKDFPGTEDRRLVWEHDHPAPSAMATIGGVLRDAFLTGSSTAIAIDPITGDPWASNEVRTATKRFYGRSARGWDADMWPGQLGATSAERHLDIWPDPVATRGYDAMDPRWLDAVTSLSFCDDGTLWAASSLHGLARIQIDRVGWTLSISQVDLPAGLGNSAYAVACDPTDGSIWVGFGWGGFGRYDGRWQFAPSAAEAPFASRNPVRSIQIDRSASPRIVYFAHAATKTAPGGLTAYAGP